MSEPPKSVQTVSLEMTGGTRDGSGRVGAPTHPAARADDQGLGDLTRSDRRGTAVAEASGAHQAIMRRRLDRCLPGLFAELTGLHFQIAWVRPLPASDAGDAVQAIEIFVACRPLAEDIDGAGAYCEKCRAKHLAAALLHPNGIRFVCRFRMRNYWLPIRSCGNLLGIVSMQVRAGGEAPGKSNSAGARGGPPRGQRLGSKDFARATRLLYFVIRSVEELSMADLRKLVPTHTSPAQVAMNGGAARLCDARHRLPPEPTLIPAPRARTHAEQVLERLLPFIAQNYARPITLRDCAEGLNLNAAYLSAIFSRIVGTPFKTYLTGIRINRAMELLGEPANNVATVAAAVGYASGDRFRRAFKQATGLSPTVWRAAMCGESPTG